MDFPLAQLEYQANLAISCTKNKPLSNTYMGKITNGKCITYNCSNKSAEAKLERIAFCFLLKGKHQRANSGRSCFNF